MAIARRPSFHVQVLQSHFVPNGCATTIRRHGVSCGFCRVGHLIMDEEIVDENKKKKQKVIRIYATRLDVQ